MDILDFPGHSLVGHLVSAMAIYVLGLYYDLRGLKLIKPVYGRTKKLRRKMWVAFFMMACGTLFATFHAIQVAAALGSSPKQRGKVAASATLAAMGLCLLAAGVVKLAFASDCSHGISIDLSTFLGFGALSLGIFLGAKGAFNVVHYAFGAFIAAAGIVDVLDQIVGGRRLLLLVGTFIVASSALLVAASDDIVRWSTREGARLGVGPLVILCILFAAVHIVVLALVARRKNRQHLSPAAAAAEGDYPMDDILTPYKPADRNGTERKLPKFSIVNSEEDDDGEP